LDAYCIQPIGGGGIHSVLLGALKTLSQTLRISMFTVEKYLREYDSEDKTNGNDRGGSGSKIGQNKTKTRRKILLR